MPKDYIKSKGWKYKVEGQEYVLEKCPYCEDSKFHFYINSTSSLFHCKKCNVKGGLATLKKDMGDLKIGSLVSVSKKETKVLDSDLAVKYHKNMSDTAREYWNSRLITPETIDKFYLGSCKEGDIEYITIPHYKGGKLINIKKRTIPPAKKTFRREAGCETILFNEDCLSVYDEIILCEGETDALTLIQEGYDNVVGMTAGVMSFVPQYYDALKNKKKIYVCMDEGDKNNEGQKGAEDIARRLGREKCRNVTILPGAHDINGLKAKMKDNFKAVFDDLISHAKEFRIPNVITFEEALNLMSFDEEESIEPFTAWENVNKLMGKIKDGYLIVISALSKIGKSSFAENILHYQVTRRDCPVLYYCLEMLPTDIIHRFCTIHYNKAGITQPERENLSEEIGNNKFVIGFNETTLTPEIMFETIREAVGRYGIKIVVFDHIHFLFRGHQIDEQVGTFMRDAKLLATELQFKFIIIAQPKKIDDINRMLNSQDLKFGQSIYSDCDVLMFLNRKRIESKEGQEGNEAFSKSTKVRVEGSRYSAGGETILRFEGDTKRFLEIGRVEDEREVYQKD